MIRFCCSGCNSGIEVPEDRGGDLIHCPRCGQRTRVPTLVPIEPVPDPGVAAVRPWVTGGNAQPGGVRLRRKWFRSVLGWAVYRFASPATLLVALLLFPLPWVQIQCDRPIGDSGTRTLVEQSGLQAIYGGYSENPLLRNAQFERQRKSAQEELLQKDGTVPRSPWLTLYPLLLVSGILAGLLVWSNPRRSMLLIGCSASAGLVLFLQAWIGFPLERALPRTVATQVGLGQRVGIEISAPTLLESRYTGWFWLTTVAVLGSLAAAGTEFWIMRKSTRPCCGEAWRGHRAVWGRGG
jgi:hypothetical protein